MRNETIIDERKVYSLHNLLLFNGVISISLSRFCLHSFKDIVVFVVFRLFVRVFFRSHRNLPATELKNVSDIFVYYIKFIR